MSADTHPCPCCGYRTYTLPAGGTMQLCPVCGWEDALGDYTWNGSNKVTLPIAQRNFKAIRACEESLVDLVRPPEAKEERPPDWTTFEESCHAIIQFIEQAFQNVSLEGGTRLDQCLDDCSTPESLQKLLTITPRKRWQDIPRQDIETQGFSLTFLDPKGIRFHLPAFMRLSLELWLESTFADFMDSDMLIYGLSEGPRSQGYHRDDFQLLDHSQHRAVAAYLKFVAVCRSFCEKDARKGLENGWQDWLPDFIPFPSLQ